MAFCMCDANDATKSYFVAAQDTIGRAVPPETIARVWSEYHLAVRRTDTSAPKISDEEAARLGRLLTAGHVSHLPVPMQSEVRRLLRWCLDQIGPDDVVDDDGTVYEAKAG